MSEGQGISGLPRVIVVVRDGILESVLADDPESFELITIDIDEKSDDKPVIVQQDDAEIYDEDGDTAGKYVKALEDSETDRLILDLEGKALPDPDEESKDAEETP